MTLSPGPSSPDIETTAATHEGVTWPARDAPLGADEAAARSLQHVWLYKALAERFPASRDVPTKAVLALEQQLWKVRAQGAV